MSPRPPTAEEQLRFLSDFPTLLDEGQFTATYKFALRVALADLAVEMGDDSGAPLTIPIRKIAEKFVHYYWRQAAPWTPAGRPARAGVLEQNAGKQAEVITKLLAVRERVSPYVVDVRRDPKAWSALLSRVERTVKVMPLWKLQRLPGRVHDFLYSHAEAGGTIELHPGVAFNLRRFHPLVSGVARARWADFVRGLKKNQPLLGQAVDLHTFLFGGERASLGDYAGLLRELQGGACFYCRRKIAGRSAVDHFVPWARYPVDLGHNFVLADPGCNGRKADFLAGVAHLERWVRRNDDHREELSRRFSGLHAPHDLEASMQIAAWAYGQVEKSAGQV